MNIGRSVERHVRINLDDFPRLSDCPQPAEGSKSSRQLGQCRGRAVHAQPGDSAVDFVGGLAGRANRLDDRNACGHGSSRTIQRSHEGLHELRSRLRLIRRRSIEDRMQRQGGNLPNSRRPVVQVRQDHLPDARDLRRRQGASTHRQQQRGNAAACCRLEPIAQESHSLTAVALARHADQHLDGCQQRVVLAGQPRDRLAECRGAIAVEVVLSLPAQQHQHELPASQTIRTVGKAVDSQVLTRQQERLAGEDPFENPDWLETILLGDLDVSPSLDDLCFSHIHEPDRQDQLGLGNRGFQIENFLLVPSANDQAGIAGTCSGEGVPRWRGDPLRCSRRRYSLW